jgi:hypothetical protein
VELSRSGRVAVLQGSYFVATGVWPLLSRRTFEAITGPKADFWLAQAVGVLVGCLGGTLLVEGTRGRVDSATRWLAASSAAGLAAIDVLYVARGRISKVYLADAAIEAALVLLWIAQRTTEPVLPTDVG